MKRKAKILVEIAANQTEQYLNEKHDVYQRNAPIVELSHLHQGIQPCPGGPTNTFQNRYNGKNTEPSLPIPDFITNLQESKKKKKKKKPNLKIS